jgi:hypothetical protein
VEDPAAGQGRGSVRRRLRVGASAEWTSGMRVARWRASGLPKAASPEASRRVTFYFFPFLFYYVLSFLAR